MFELLFPIFCFGVLVTAIVLKGLLLAAEENRLQAHPKFEVENLKILRAFQPGDAASQQIRGSTSASMRRRS
jgi:hypothetical protein